MAERRSTDRAMSDDPVGACARARRADDERAQRAHRHQSVLFYMGDGKVEIDSRRRAAGEASRQVLPDGRRPAPAEDAGQADLDRFLQAAASPRPPTCCRAPPMRSRPGIDGEDRARLPAARHRRRQLHPLRPRLLGRAADRALCRRGGELGGPHAPGAALLPRRVRRLRAIPTCTSSCSAPTTSPSPTSSPNTSAPGTHKWYMTARLITHQRHLLVRSQRQGQPRRFRRHHRPQLQAAEGRPRLRQQPVGAYVAHHDVADAVPVRQR